jgi:O-antigen/teichoic acid export membrane protein
VAVIGGADFDGAVTPLRILLVAGALALVNGIFGLALIARERQMAALWLNVAALTFNVGLNLALVPDYGIVAAAIVTVASEMLILAGSYPLMRRHLGFFPSPGTLGAALAAAAVMAAVLFPVREAPLAVTLPLGAALYGAVLYALSPRTRAALAGLRG